MAKEKVCWTNERSPNKKFDTEYAADYDEALGLVCDGDNSLLHQLYTRKCGVDILEVILSNFEVLDKIKDLMEKHN